MTLFYPDISSYESGISLSGMAAVVVKATEGTTYTNPDYARVAADATARGIPWAAYHFLHHNSDPAAQARYFHSVAGNAPCMLDVETAGDGTKATVADCLSFASTLKGLGGFVRLAYFPHWYWQALGSPDLTPLANAGIGLVSSNYTAYSDTGPGWASYGGVTPVVWQYTDAHALNGFSVDYNAYRGTADQFRTLLTGEALPMSDFLPVVAVREPGKTKDTDIWISNLLFRRQLGPGEAAVDNSTIYWNMGGNTQTPPEGLPINENWPTANLPALGVDIATLTTGGVDTTALAALLAPSLPSAADVATHLDYNQLAAAIVSHFKID